MGVRLPAEYQEVEYIESTGEQVINLNINPRGSDSKDHFKMYIKMRPSIAKTSNNYFFGANVNYFTFEYYDYPNRGYYFNLGTSTVLFPHNRSVGGEDVEYLITCDSGIATVTGTYDGTANYTYRIGQGPLGIFSRYNKDCYSTMRLYQLQFWQGESYPCIGEYIPCYRKFDNKPGLYDLVTRAFYTNAGTGEFIVGPDVIDSISPWLVARRRMLMKEQEHWDFIFLADETGTIPPQNMRDGLGLVLLAGESITIAYDTGGAEGLDTSYLYSGSGELNEPRSMLQKDLSSSKGEVVVTAWRNRPQIFISRAWSGQAAQYRFVGKYIKIRINK